MSTETAPTKRGNPNFGKKPQVTLPDNDSDILVMDAPEPEAIAAPVQRQNNFKRKTPIAEPIKIYEFELVKSYEKYKPNDRDTGKAIGSPYPPLYGRPNEGIAFDESYDNGDGTKGRARNWRYIEGQPSIWVDEQPALKDAEPKYIYTLLGQPENQLDFTHGKMNVSSIKKLRLAALMCQDAFEGKEQQYNPRPREYRLNNPDKLISNSIDAMTAEYSAMKLAMECSTEEMIYAAYVMGIDTQDLSDSGLNRIKQIFLSKAKYDPANPKSIEFFVQVMTNPATKASYLFAQGIKEGIISANQLQNKLTWVNTQVPICTVNSAGNVVDQLVRMYIDRDDKVSKVLDQIEYQLNQ